MTQSSRAFLFALLAILGGCTGRLDGVEPVTPFDINSYQGVWYKIMRLDHSFKRSLTKVTATYELGDDGTVGVLNRGTDHDRGARRQTRRHLERCAFSVMGLP